MASPEQISFLEVWEAGEPSPFRRPERPVGVRRSRRTRWPRMAGIVLVDFAVLVTLLAVCWKVVERAQQSSRFALSPARDVRLMGNHFVERDQVLDQLGFDDLAAWSPSSIFDVNLAEARKRAESLPWVRSAAVSRVFPHGLALRIEEQNPVAFANADGRIELVDSQGTFLPAPPKATFDFPVIHGLNAIANAAQREDLLNSYSRFIGAAHDELSGSGWQISEVYLSDGGNVRALLVQGDQTIMADFGDRDYHQRLARFTALAPRALQTYLKINSMDLRYSNEVVVDPALPDPQTGSRTQPQAMPNVHQ